MVHSYEHRRAILSNSHEAISLINLGSAFGNLGDPSKQKDLVEEALATPPGQLRIQLGPMVWIWWYVWAVFHWNFWVISGRVWVVLVRVAVWQRNPIVSWLRWHPLPCCQSCALNVTRSGEGRVFVHPSNPDPLHFGGAIPDGIVATALVNLGRLGRSNA